MISQGLICLWAFGGIMPPVAPAAVKRIWQMTEIIIPWVVYLKPTSATNTSSASSTTNTSSTSSTSRASTSSTTCATGTTSTSSTTGTTSTTSPTGTASTILVACGCVSGRK